MATITCSAQIATSQPAPKLASFSGETLVPIEPAFWSQVSGGAPKGGWAVATSGSAMQSDSTQAPKGGW